MRINQCDKCKKNGRTLHLVTCEILKPVYLRFELCNDCARKLLHYVDGKEPDRILGPFELISLGSIEQLIPNSDILDIIIDPERRQEKEI